MKRKEINEYAQSIVVKLYDIGYFGSVQESVSTNSFYIHITQVPDIIRLSEVLKMVNIFIACLMMGLKHL